MFSAAKLIHFIVINKFFGRKCSKFSHFVVIHHSHFPFLHISHLYFVGHLHLYLPAFLHVNHHILLHLSLHARLHVYYTDGLYLSPAKNLHQLVPTLSYHIAPHPLHLYIPPVWHQSVPDGHVFLNSAPKAPYLSTKGSRSLHLVFRKSAPYLP